jgi:23S rRNA (pseudouridine1915-N3)-methyltransferase
MKLYLYYVGKSRDLHANAMAEEYIKRSGRFAKCEMREIHPERYDLWGKHAAATKILLDPAGDPYDSPGLIALVKKAVENARDLVFVIGGADGLPPEWKPRADLVMTLSQLTMPHELARVVLAEQIYRAVSWLNGHPYAR